MELSELEIDLLLKLLKEKNSYYFNNCTDNSVDDEWCIQSNLIRRLEKLLSYKLGKED